MRKIKLFRAVLFGTEFAEDVISINIHPKGLPPGIGRVRKQRDMED